MTFNPPFLPLQTATLALLIIGAAFLLYARWELRQRARRSLPLLLLRAASVLCLAFILMNPVVKSAAPQSKEKPTFTILLDTSRSMNTSDAVRQNDSGEKTEATRWQSAKQSVLENHALRDALNSRYNVRFVGFASKVTPQSPDALQNLTAPNGDRTSIGDALYQTAQAAGEATPNKDAKQIPVRGGILLVSDGRDNGAGFPLDAARIARSQGLPVYTLCVGKESAGQDVQIVAQRPQVWAEPNQTIELTVSLRDNGIPRTQTQVDLLREGRRVETKMVTIAPGSREVTFEVREPRKGFYRYAVACAPVSGETDVNNNRANVFLNVMNSRARVLLLEGYPTWDAKFLAQALHDDQTIALDSLYQLTDSRTFALSGSANRPTIQVPQTLAEFSQYDVLILGKGFEAFFKTDAEVNALKKWISERGGNVVFLRGRADEHTEALREIEPVTFGETEIENVRARLTEAGRAYPGFAFRASADAQTVVQKLPSLISATQTQGEKALAVILARAQTGDGANNDASSPEMALLAYQRYGQGKVMAVIGEGLWRWAFLPPEQAQYERVYADFWTQTVRWLVSESDFLPGQNLALRTDKTAYSLKETVNLLGYLRGAKPAQPPIIAITQPDGKTAQVVSSFGDGKSADFAAPFRPAQPGEYVATVPPLIPNEKAAPASVAFTVYPGQEEDANRSADPNLMRQIAAVGGGQALQPEALSLLPEKLRAQELAAAPPSEPRTAWDRGWVLAALLALFAAEWTLRRRLGLP